MLEGYEKIEIPDEDGDNPLVCEVNWSPKDKRTNGCKVLRFTFPDGTESYVKREYLNSILFAIGREEDQRNLIPNRVQTIRKYQTMLSITAKKDVRKGEQIFVNVDIPLPPIEKEIYEEAKRQASRMVLK